jgi:UDP-N-acetyl-D-glucosamine dehydrogenase
MLALDASRTSARESFREELHREIEAGSVRCGVVGLGFIGSVLMDALIAAGLNARGYDRGAEAVARFLRHRASLPEADQTLCACDVSPGVISDCNVIFVAVRNLVDDGVVNEEPLKSAACLIKQHLRPPCLVILESTVAPGTTRRFADEIGAAEDAGVFVAHAPERLAAGQDHLTLRATPHLVAGIGADATQLASAMLGKICNRVVPASAPEVTELSKLLENAFLSVNIALTSEVTRMCVSLGIRAQEVCLAAATKPQGFMPFYPGAGLGGHCLPNDLVLFAESARGQGWEPELLNGAIAVNGRAPHLVVDRLEQSMGALGMQLCGTQVLIVGVGFKAGSPDTTRSPALEVVRALHRRGASVSYIDSLVPEFLVDGVPIARMISANLTPGAFTTGIILSGDKQLSEQSLIGACTLVLDAGGSRSKRPMVPGIETL